MSMVEIRIQIPVSMAEAVETALAEAENADWGVFEDRPSASAWLGSYFSDSATAQAAVDRARADLGMLIDLAHPESRQVADADWRESYKAHFQPWQFGRMHWVPVWERETYAVPPGDVAVLLDPGMAFGTGNHETTRLCCERMVALAESRGMGAGKLPLSAIDAGCGSGILAISAVKLGFRPVSGFDNDPEAVAVSRDNAQLNGTASEVDFFVGDLITGLQGRQADLVMANILANVLCQFASELVAAVAPGGWLVLSGILATEIDVVGETFARSAPGWAIESRTLGEWSDLRLIRP
jgi:ribosomal protein L11 methyltransferase